VAGHVVAGTLTAENYRTWMAVDRTGTRRPVWMRMAAANLPEHLRSLGELIEGMRREQNDWRVLHADYVAAGGAHANLTISGATRAPKH